MLVAVVAAVSPGLMTALPARAGIGAGVLADCSLHLALTRTYSVAELQNALATMPAEVNEYSDCHDVISRALTNALGGHGKNNGSGSDSGGSFVPAPLIVVIVLLTLAAAGLGTLAVRRRRVR